MKGIKGTDKFLAGLVGGALVLVIVAIVVASLQPKPTYQPEDTPEGVAHNYLLALQQGDYERAYRYLSPSLENYPASVEKFTDDVSRYSWQFRDLEAGSTNVAVDTARVTGDRAVVSVREIRFYQGDLFSSGQNTSVFEMRLRLENGVWRITGSDSYWVWCWDNKQGCR